MQHPEYRDTAFRRPVSTSTGRSRGLLSLIVLLPSLSAIAQERIVPVVPLPQEVEFTDSAFSLIGINGDAVASG
ncbi:MAG TPA: hypothetical protein VMO47_13505, partial [Rhodothermales bacterium]|nr:hypothetical protein [Rhodothermales bacterium]